MEPEPDLGSEELLVLQGSGRSQRLGQLDTNEGDVSSREDHQQSLYLCG